MKQEEVRTHTIRTTYENAESLHSIRCGRTSSPLFHLTQHYTQSGSSVNPCVLDRYNRRIKHDT
jgi:hypothetical protein